MRVFNDGVLIMIVKVLRDIRIPYCGDIPAGSIGIVRWMDPDRDWET